MPSNIEAEQAVLGSLLLSKEKYPEVDALINPGDFESEAHREIYECIKQLADEGKGIDHITVSKQLDRKNSLQRVGGVDYLKELQKVPVSALAADSYANLVKDQSIDRNLKKVLREIIKITDEPKGKTSDQILNEAEAKIFELSENRTKNDSLKKIELLSPEENEEENLSKRRKILISQDKIITALETGRQTLDEENGLNDKIRKFSNVFGKLEDLEDEDIKKINLLVQELYINLEELTNIINSKNINQHYFSLFIFR